MTSLPSVDLPNDFDEYAYAAVVADGIGRAGTGSVASRLAISRLAPLALRFASAQILIECTWPKSPELYGAKVSATGPAGFVASNVGGFC